MKIRQNISMKKIVFCFLILLTLFTAGCGAKECPSAIITRDEAHTGGNLSFVYDANDKKVYVGGEGEFLQFSSADEVKDLEEGYRVGIKVSAPSGVEGFESASLEVNGVTYGDFWEKIEGQDGRYFYLYPTFSEKVKKSSFTLTYNKNCKPQKYTIYLNDKTNFLKNE